jgi:NAD(P)-dependent dehydrogenase (short-subunit alcohol dehydrogenase family)
MFDIAYENFPQIDILVNNAGYHSSEKYTIEDLSEDQWNNSMRVNLSSQVWCTKEVVKKMKEKKWGRIINLSSITGQRGSRSGDICYTIAKIGNHGLTLGLYQQLAKYNITINTVSPGTIDTPGTHRVLPSESIVTDYVRLIPLNRIGTANEIAEMISFLSSDRAAYITGQIISINGGAWV